MLDPNEKKATLDPTNLILIDEEADASENDEIFVCPECGSDSIIVVSHCKTCASCGWSLCSF